MEARPRPEYFYQRLHNKQTTNPQDHNDLSEGPVVKVSQL